MRWMLATGLALVTLGAGCHWGLSDCQWQTDTEVISFDASLLQGEISSDGEMSDAAVDFVSRECHQRCPDAGFCNLGTEDHWDYNGQWVTDYVLNCPGESCVTPM
ncbi:MAG: hypothetical protein PHU25_17185 [Deltaproteobacteria bacterium]|nr:hypothetical protein [Deltaproteobacteria bacterium]